MICLDTDFASVLAKAGIIGLVKKQNNLLKAEMYMYCTYTPF